MGWGGPGSAQFCLECQGKHLPPELEIIDMGVDMPSKKAEGKCDCCGKTKRIKKVNGYMACSVCEHLVRAVKNSPELVRRLWSDVHGYVVGGNEEGLAEGIRQALNVSGDVSADELPEMITDLMRERGEYAAELDRVRKALDGAVDDDLVDVAESLRKEVNAYAAQIVNTACALGEDASWCGYLPDLAELVISDIKRAAGVDDDFTCDDLCLHIADLRESHHVQRLRDQSKTATMEVAPTKDMIPLSRLVADEELRVQIDGLAKLLGERP